MKRVLFSLSAAFAVLSAGAVQAADIPMKTAPAPVVRAASWTGCYIGAGFGYGVGQVQHSAHDAVTGQVFDIGHDNGIKGWLITVGGGCDYQLAPSWVIGALVDFDWTNLKGNLSYNCPGGCAGPTGFAGEGKTRGAWHVGGRIGYLVTPQILSYFNGGWTQIRLDDVSYIDASGTTGTTTVMGAQTFNGWFLGGGTEVAMPSWPGLTWKTEYRYASYSSQDGNAICATAGCGGVGTVHSVNTLRPYVQTIRSSLVWRFNFR